MYLQRRLILRPVWDWGEQFSDKDLALFTNPLYKKPPEQQINARKTLAMVLPPTAVPLPGLHNRSNARFSVNLANALGSPAHTQRTQPEVSFPRTKCLTFLFHFL